MLALGAEAPQAMILLIVILPGNRMTTGNRGRLGCKSWNGPLGSRLFKNFAYVGNWRIVEPPVFLYRFGGLPEWLRPPSDAVHLHLLEWETASCESGVGQCLGLLGNHSSKLHPQVAPEKKGNGHGAPAGLCQGDPAEPPWKGRAKARGGTAHGTAFQQR